MMNQRENFRRQKSQNEVEAEIADAMKRSSYKWRTVNSLAKELDVSPALVNDILRTSDKFVKARKSNSRGQALFTTASRYKSETPLWTRLLGAGANTVVR
jgi:hypothetical protein